MSEIELEPLLPGLRREGGGGMSIENEFSTLDDIIRGVGFAMRTVIDCEEKAHDLVKVMGEEAFDFVAKANGYAKERTYHDALPAKYGEPIEGYWECSECGCEIGDCSAPNYCPVCGAKVVE